MRTEQQIENLRLVKQIIQAKIDRNEPRDMLELWSQPCGTKGCVLGDYIIKTRPRTYGRMRDIRLVAETLCRPSEFGIKNEESWDLFGGTIFGTLRDRLQVVNRLLGE